MPTRPLVPFVECVHDRIAIEIMRGCPWQCRFCQSTVIKRPLRSRSVETIVRAARESYQTQASTRSRCCPSPAATIPHFEQLVRRLKEVFQPLGVNISVPSLRVNDQLRTIAQLIGNDRRSSLTLAPEVARDDMREQIRKKIKNDDLYEGCRAGLWPRLRERQALLHVRPARRTPRRSGWHRRHGGNHRHDWQGGARAIRQGDRQCLELRPQSAHALSVERDADPRVLSLDSRTLRQPLPAALRHDQVSRRRTRACWRACSAEATAGSAEAIELAWRRGARLDSWREQIECGSLVAGLGGCGNRCPASDPPPYELTDILPWDHVNVKYGRTFLEKEQLRSAAQLHSMAEAK